MSFRKNSGDKGMGCIGSCAPLCWPAKTDVRICCWALSAPKTSSRLYNSRELPRWWP